MKTNRGLVAEKLPAFTVSCIALATALIFSPGQALATRPIGIDVSDYQSASIDWNLLKNTYGITFGWAKISEGGSSSGGANFATYAANAKAAGVYLGPYHYARYDLNGGTSGATSEANYFWSRAANYIKGGGFYLVPMLDVEADFTGQTKATMSAWVNQWCNTVSNSAKTTWSVNVKPSIYTSSSKAVTYMDSTVTQWNTDIADWPYAHASAATSAQGASGPPAGISPWSTWQFWQYDDQNVAETYTTGDGDIFNGTLSQMISTMVIGSSSSPTIAISSQPAGTTVECGTSTSMTVTATGNGTLAYQWYKGSTPVGNGTSIQSFTPAHLSDAGSYTVVITDNNGSITSSPPAVLVVHDTTAPVVTLVGSTPQTVECHSSFTDAGATANDACAGSLTVTTTGNMNANAIGAYTLTYSATDGAFSATATRVLQVVDTTGPVITVSGSNPLIVECHSGFFEPGVSASDACAGSESVSTGGSMDVNTPGNYTLTYSATDGSHSITATRLVHVVDTTGPVITLVGNNPQVVVVHTTYTDAGATASDACAGNRTLTTTGTVDSDTVGSYTLTFTADDGIGHTNSATRTVNVSTVQQGTVNFNNRLIGTLVTHVYGPEPDGTTVITGSSSSDTPTGSTVYQGAPIGGTATGPNAGQNYTAQLWAVTGIGSTGLSHPEGDLQPVSYYTTAFRTITGLAGIFVPTDSNNDPGIPNSPAGGSFYSATVQLRVWYNNGGTLTTWDQAVAANGLIGKSSLINIAALGQTGIPPTITPNLAGLTSFNLHSNAAVSGPLTILTQPSGSTVQCHNSATLSVIATGTGSLSYQWYKGVNPIGNGNPSLTFNPAALSDADSYTVVVTDSSGSVTSSPPAVLVVNDTIAPVISVTGSNPFQLTLHNTFTDPGATASDTCAGSRSVSTAGSVSQDIVGAYTLTYTANDGNGNTGTATRTVNVVDNIPPAIAVQPTNKTVECHVDTTLVSTATGTATLRYQWYQRTPSVTNALSSGTNATLSLNAISSSQAGSYTVVVTNNFGNVTSAVAVVTVVDTTAPVLTVTGANPYRLVLHTTFTDPSATATDTCAGTLTVSTGGSVNNNTVGNYTLTYSATDGSHPVSATRVVNVVDEIPATISTQPTNQTIQCHANVTLVSAAAGSGLISYQWYLAANALANATNATLTVPATTPANAGSYTVEVTNAFGSATSAEAVITIVDTAAPVITVSGSTVQTVECHAGYADAGATASDTCTGSVSVSTSGGVNANSPGNYTLTYAATDGVNSATATRVVHVIDTILPVISANGSNPLNMALHGIYSDPGASASDTCAGVLTGSIVTTGSVNSDAVGSYTTTYSVTDGGFTSTATRVVNVIGDPPVITSLSSNQTVNAGTSLVLQVACTGASPFTYGWQYNGAPLANGGRISGADADTLTIASVTASNAGSYTVVIGNVSGTITSAPVLVGVRDPVILLQPVDGYVPVGGFFTNHVVAAGTANLHYQWYRLLNNGTVVSNLVNQTNSFLVCTAGTVRGTAQYYVVVTNRLGLVLSRAATLYIGKTPLTVTVTGTGTTTPGGVTTYGSPANGALLIPGTNYVINAVPGRNCIFTNWTDGNGVPLTNATRLAFTMNTNLVLTANFLTNPIIAASANGTYNGLFYEVAAGVPNVQTKSAGMIRSMAVTTNGGYSCAFLLGGKTYPAGYATTPTILMTGKFDNTGNSTLIVKRVNPLSNLVATLHLDWQNDTKKITGTVSNTDLADPWVAPLLLDKVFYNTTNHFAFPLRFTAALPPVGESANVETATAGYLPMRVTNSVTGVSTISGTSPDGATFSSALPISKDGFVPVYASMNAGAEVVAGWLQVSNNLTGILSRVQNPSTNAALELAGIINANAAVHGAVFNPLAIPVLPKTNFYLVLEDGVGAGLPLTYNLQLKKTNFVKVGTTPSNGLTGFVTSSSGTFSVTFHPTSNATKTVTGVLFQDGNTNNQASGFWGHSRAAIINYAH